jgi:hypothetical protein
MAFEEIDAMASESEETPEVAEPADETTESSEEIQETAEPDSEGADGRTEADAAFADMRRRMEAAERKLAEREAEDAKRAALQAAEDEAVAEMSGYDDIEYLIAESSGKSIEEVRAEVAFRKEYEELKYDNEVLQKELSEVRADKTIAEDLAAIQKFDPSVKSLADLPESFEAYRLDAGLTAQQAYFAAKAEKEATEIKPAKPIGQVNQAPVEKDRYTEEEVYAMTSEEREAKWEKIMESLPYWKKK